MQEVIITLRFNRECLGAARRSRSGQTTFCFDRDADGRVMFFSSAWLSGLRYAAKIANKHHTAVKKIDWCHIVNGITCTDWRRTVCAAQGSEQTNSHFAVHEAFPPGERVVVSAVLPPEISILEFDQLLTLVGKYRGISPFHNAQEKYGKFEVISIKPSSGAESS